MATVILSVGSCGFDDSRLGRMLRENVGALLDRAHTAADAQQMMGEKQYALVLVNRVFDGDGDSGVDFIASAKRAGHQTPMMLVSDYSDAQRAAVENGAITGFGKSTMTTPDVINRIKTAIGAAVS